MSGYLLAFVAVERFYAVVRPANIRKRITVNKIKYIVSFCWAVASLQIIPSLITGSYVDEAELCQEIYPQTWHQAAYWSLILFLVGVIPVSVMAVLYSTIIHSLWLQIDNSDVRRRSLNNARRRITVECIAVSVFYVVCVFPSHIFYVASVFFPRVFEYGDTSFKISYALLVLNSSVNPFIYTQCSRFRACIKRLLGCASVVPQAPH